MCDEGWPCELEELTKNHFDSCERESEGRRLQQRQTFFSMHKKLIPRRRIRHASRLFLLTFLSLTRVFIEISSHCARDDDENEGKDGAVFFFNKSIG